MSIAKPCPYSAESEFCKYEKDTGTPNLKMCDKCNWSPKKSRLILSILTKRDRRNSQQNIKVLIAVI